jgi:two-component system, OmpR family, osmolarity sensor histidine kinase EnvZ
MKPTRWTFRPRSLFSRLLLAQAVLAVALTVLLAALFYSERNRTVAQLVAERWAPVLREAAGLAVTPRAPGFQTSSPPLRSATRPARTVWAPAAAPRLSALREALRAQGVEVQEMAFARNAAATDTPTLWLAVATSDGQVQWLGFSGDVIEPHLRNRVLLAIVLAVLLIVALVATITRRLTRPLERLRERLDAYGAGRAMPPPAKAAPGEIAAIDAAFTQLRERLERQERERALLLAGVSHDLRSPLARIRMAAGLLPEAEGVAARREAIERNAALADRLVQSFLDHVRSGELALNEAVDVAAIARAAVQQQLRSADDLRLEAPAELMLTRAHPLLIERVITNLLDNAFAHGRPPVTLRLREQHGDPGGEVHIEVEDRGEGIAPEASDTLLQAFARGDASRSRPGLGLGLAVVQRVVQRLQGRIEFERLPAQDSAPPKHVVRVVVPKSAPVGTETERHLP